MRNLPVPALLFVLAAACAPARSVVRSSGGWVVEGAPYFVAPCTGGELMPHGWELDNYEEDDAGVLRLKDKRDGLDLHFKRVTDDGHLFVASALISADDERKSMNTLVERQLGSLRHHVTGVTFSYLGAMVSTRDYDLLFQRKPQPLVVDGAEAMELIVEQVVPGASTGDRRTYVALLRSIGKPRLTVVLYRNAPALFDAGLPDIAGLISRMQF